MSACRSLEDQITHVQYLLTNEGNSRRFADDENKARMDASLQFIATLKNEIDAQKKLLADRKRQNVDLSNELSRTQDSIESKKLENMRSKSDLHG